VGDGKGVSVGVYSGIDQGAPAFWYEHVLEACEGFRVKKGGRFLGFVESVRWEQGEPLELIVEVGRAQPRRLLVPVADVARIVAGRFARRARAGTGRRLCERGVLYERHSENVVVPG